MKDDNMRYILILLFSCGLSAQDLVPDSSLLNLSAIQPVEEIVTNYPTGSPIFEDGQRILYFNPRKNVSRFFSSNYTHKVLQEAKMLHLRTIQASLSFSEF